jgi:hypothetical protein
MANLSVGALAPDPARTAVTHEDAQSSPWPKATEEISR